MGKSKKSSPRRDLEQLQKMIAKDLEEKNFGSPEEANRYIQSKYIGKNFPSGNKKISLKEKATDLIYDAWDSDNRNEKIALAEKALKLDENCADAYNILAQYKAKSSVESLEYYALGIEAGKKSLGKDFERLRGHFWGFHETRPFMRALGGYSDILWLSGEERKSIEVLIEMLELNPNDNQGMRYILISRLLLLNMLPEAERLYKAYKDDFSAHWNYSKAYIDFNKKSKSDYADNELKTAMENNPYVPLYLLGLFDMPDILPEYIGIGDKNEAIVYADDAIELWTENKKALKWFIGMYGKMQDEIDELIKKRERDEKKRYEKFFDKK